MLPRADVHDRLIGALSLEELKQGARVASSPKALQHQLYVQPDLQIIAIMRCRHSACAYFGYSDGMQLC
jgi:hydroxymethylbilane synthase